MNTDLGARVRRHIASLPVPPRPPFAEPAPHRMAKLVPAAAALAVLAVLAVLLTGVVRWGDGGGGPQFADDGRRPGLPDRWARYSHFTGSVGQSRPGPAIAVYQHGWGVELFDFPQGLVLSAYADVYRRVDLADDRDDSQDQGAPAPMLLSPDGTRLAVGSHQGLGDLALLDLSTGRVTSVAAAAGKGVRPLAWSRDGRHIAAIELPAQAYNQTHAGELVVFDLTTGTAKRWPAHQGIAMAAFSPDGTELALQAPGGITVIDLDGRVRRRPLTGEGIALTSEAAWSPDGRLLAIVRTDDRHTNAVTFLDAMGQGVPVPAPIQPAGHDAVVGWTGPERILLVVRPDDRFVEVDVTTGRSRVLSRFDTGPSDGYALARVQFASQLLLDVSVRPAGEPDRGRWPVWTQVTATVLLLALGLAGAHAVRTVIVRRRLSPRPGPVHG